MPPVPPLDPPLFSLMFSDWEYHNEDPAYLQIFYSLDPLQLMLAVYLALPFQANNHPVLFAEVMFCYILCFPYHLLKGWLS